MKLYELTGAYAMLAQADATDDEGFAAALAELSDAIEDKAENVAAVVRTLEGEADIIAVEAKRLAERAQVRWNRAESLKQYLLAQLTAAGLASVRGKLYTVGVEASPPALKVTDMTAVPSQYLVPQPPKVDSRGILAAWKESGELPPGVAVERGQHLRIR